MKNYIKLSFYATVVGILALASNNAYSTEDEPEEGTSVCSEAGCYVFKCSGTGLDRTCGWSFEERDPFDRGFEKIQ